VPAPSELLVDIHSSYLLRGSHTPYPILYLNSTLLTEYGPSGAFSIPYLNRDRSTIETNKP
jgi:hypothetical protein